MFEDYAYQQGDEALPQPGTSDGGFDWNDFLNTVVGGVERIVQVEKSPSWDPNTGTYRPAWQGPIQQSSNNVMLLVVAAVLVYALMS